MMIFSKTQHGLLRKQKFVLMVLVSLVFYFLLIAETHAQGLNLIVCDGPDCTFSHLITLAKNLINALIIISTFLATAAFAYAGFILLTSGGNESAKNKAKDIFLKVLKGYLWILGAWLLVYTITSALLNTGFSLLGPP